MTALLTPMYLFFVPVLAAVLVVAVSRVHRAAAPLVALIGPVLTLVAAAAYLFAEKPALSAGPGDVFAAGGVASTGTVRWFLLGDIDLSLAWTVDGLAAAMLMVVGVVSACVIVFSAGYMAGDKGWARYFALLSLFSGSMNLVVIASSFPALFMGWELVGACSFLLIGFWYRRPAAAAAAIKAFITTRVGDVGLLLGIATLWSATSESSYSGALGSLGAVPTGIVTAAAVSIAVGAIGKSAQFPLHAWLPDAMEGPTPVSALIHAATMVAAGVYLVVRIWPLFEAAPVARLVLLAAGTFSALGAALIALPQRDIKKVLAYSTVSQLGFMFVALGAGAWFAAFFHLVAHAAFKALLFLTSGSVIHGSGTQDMHEMGGLRHTMGFTFAAWMVGVLSLTGIPGLAGFFSKDLLLESVWHFSPVMGVVLFAGSVLTAFYSARSTRLVFFGAPQGDHAAHESPATMLVPMGVLASLVLVVGWLGASLAEVLGTETEGLNLIISAVAVLSALLGGVAGWMSANGPEGDRHTAESLGTTWRVLAGAFLWDSAVNRTIVIPTVAASRTIWAVGDRLVADGLAEGSGRVARWAGRSLSRLQGGDAQSYATVVALGLVLMVMATFWLGR